MNFQLKDDLPMELILYKTKRCKLTSFALGLYDSYLTNKVHKQLFTLEIRSHRIFNTKWYLSTCLIPNVDEKSNLIGSL